MLDFFMVSYRRNKNETVDIYPKFIVRRSKDLMIRGGDFYAVWVEEKQLWSTDEQDAIDMIDMALDKYADQHRDILGAVHVKHLWDAETGMIDRWHKYCSQQSRDNYHQLDEKLIFSNMKAAKQDYASRRLSYPLADGMHESYDKLISTLYNDSEKAKLEWAIGSIVSGDSTSIQKFLVLYGSAGTGKSTILNIIQMLFDGYYSVFDARALGSANNSFALEAFKSNPLVAIQHDGDLSKIEDNTRLNSLTSHEEMTVNEKFKATYATRFNCFLFMGTNKPVRITDAKSGLIRRLIDVHPSGNKIPVDEYNQLMRRIPFELGGIAKHCLDVYSSDKNKYDDYIPTAMLGASNDFYNFVMDSYFLFEQQNDTTLKQAWELYKIYCDDAKVPYPMSKRIFSEELKNYFEEYKERGVDQDGNRVRSYFYGFRQDRFNECDSAKSDFDKKKSPFKWSRKGTRSPFDILARDYQAQYANSKTGSPKTSWAKCTTTLSDLDTSELHYVRVPKNHIVIDFDLKQNGEKSLALNEEAASMWPETYAEVSKSGSGIHLHYIYDGDVSKLSRIYAEDIEIKIYSGKSSLRRQLTKHNGRSITTIDSGLPLKGVTNVINQETIKSERGLRTLIKRSLYREIHPNTKPSMDFIKKILDDAYESGLHYDVSNLRGAIVAFAASSSHQSDYCLELVQKLKLQSKDVAEVVDDGGELIFYDVEVFPNLFICNYKSQSDQKVTRLINPDAHTIESLCRYRLVGFNNRKYDNHILYARMLGYNNKQLYNLSKRIISGDGGAFFGEAYNISYTDIYDFAAKKQGLKKWEIELGIHHQELGLPWDEDVDEALWPKVAEYCDNDVIATEAVFNHLKGDFRAREILADIAGMTPNDTTNSLTTRIIFGRNRTPDLVYTHLDTGKQEGVHLKPSRYTNAFPGYEYKYDIQSKKYINFYRGVDLGKGGYVYAEPGVYEDVALLDVASLHPHSIAAMNCFGEYTQNFVDLMDARIFIKHDDFESAKKLFNGKLIPYLDDPTMAKQLAQALKIAINSVYGLTSAAFTNPFKDKRNVNNIVALRGALFMKTLQDEVQAKGYTIAHIKTDSIKIANADNDIIDFCFKFAEDYGYTFEHEATYSKICLVNDAVYIARYSDNESINHGHCNQWTAVGTQFQVPYVFKTLFSGEKVIFDDFCETKSSKAGDIYLDMNESFIQYPDAEKELKWRVGQYKKLGGKPDDYILSRNPDYKNSPDEELEDLISSQHNYVFIGKIGQFTPVKTGCDGGLVMTLNNRTGKYGAAPGTSGYRWLESEMIRKLDRFDDVDKTYHQNLAAEARSAIEKYCDFNWFVS